MQITGKITSLSQPVKIGTKQTDKQSIRVEETTGQYPNSMAIDFFGKKILELTKYKLGDEVTVEYNSRTSDYNGKIFNNISGWKVSSYGEQTLPESELPF